MIKRLTDSTMFTAFVFGWNFVAAAYDPTSARAQSNIFAAALMLLFTAQNFQRSTR